MTSANAVRRRRPPDRERLDAIKRGVLLQLELHDLRLRRGITQERVAQSLGTSRPNVSRIEHEDDVRLSTLQRYIEALDGELEVAVRFPDGERHVLLPGPDVPATPSSRS
jgi:transcriptional regulator with XRE-family HTH domain